MLGPYYINNEARRIASWGQPGAFEKGYATIAGKRLLCHAKTVGAWEVFEKIRAKHGYVPTGTDTGMYSLRHMRHDPKLPWSSHSWAVALDLNWLQNPAGSKLVTDMPIAMIKALQAVKTKSGVFVWMWGGDWDRNPGTKHSYYDAMHWEVVAHPLDLATGFDVDLPLVSPPTEGTAMALRQGDRGNAVRAVQKELNLWRPALQLVEDGIFGLRTEVGLREYQTAADLPPLGVADSLTLSFLLTTMGRNPREVQK